MQYQGGKERMARHIAPQILAHAWDKGSVYIEPFLGSAAIFTRVAPYFPHAVGSDKHPDVMLMWQALVAGWKPPRDLPEELWRELKTAEPSALRGFAGFQLSYGGNWFSSYARDLVGGRNFADHGSRIVIKAAKKLHGAELLIGDYSIHNDIVGPETVVYCDPPYAGVSGYRHVGKFDSPKFWSTMTDWTRRGATVLVSEYSAPPDWVSVWRTQAFVSMAMNNGSARAVEHIFMHKDAAES